MAKAQPYRMTKLSEIKPYDRNPRIIPQAAVDAVAKSIQAFGFRQPIVVDGQGVILAGHTRYKAAQQLGLTEVPVVWQTDIDEIKARGYRIADNKTAEISAWDRDLFDEEIKDIMQNCDFDIKDLGLADWEIQRIMQATEQGWKTDKQPDAHTPAPTYENTSESGGNTTSLQAPSAFDTEEQVERCPYCGRPLPAFSTFDPDNEDLQRARGTSVRKTSKKV